MKKSLKSALVAAVVGTGAVSSASAVSISMNDLLMGYLGPITIKYTGYNEGAIYTVPDGTYSGQATLDGLSQIRPTSPFPADSGGSQFEDSWTVFKVSTINDASNNILFYDGKIINGKKYEITGMVWGEVDVFLDQVTAFGSTNQLIRGVGLKVAFWLDEDPLVQFTTPGGPAARTGAFSYPAVNEDLLIWTGVSVPLPGSGGSYDFETTVIVSGGTITGGAGGKFTGDWAANGAGLGAWNSGFQSVPGGPDFTVRFTIDTNLNKHGFDAVVNDPLYTVAIPTPSAIWGGALLAGMVGLNFLRRRRAAE